LQWLRGYQWRYFTSYFGLPLVTLVAICCARNSDMSMLCTVFRRRTGGRFRGAISRAVRSFVGDQRGASIVIGALILPALIGAMGLAAEISYWHLHHRAMQNAADAAAIAAATNGDSSYAAEAMAVCCTIWL
jgi:Flp pilus assembly protein TadG